MQNDQLHRIEATLISIAEALERTAAAIEALPDMIESEAPDTGLVASKVPPDVRTFIAERCRTSHGARTPGSDLYRAYRDWMLGKGSAPLSQTAFGRATTDTGFERIKSNGVIMRTGISVRADARSGTVDL